MSTLPLKAADRLVYRKLRFWIKNLHITTELLTDLHNGQLLDDFQLTALQEKLAEVQPLAEAKQSEKTVELHEKLLLVVLQMSNQDVDRFLITLEKYQPDVVRHVLGGLSTQQVMVGHRGCSAPRLSTSSGSVSPTPTLTPESSIGSIESFEAVAAAEAMEVVDAGIAGAEEEPMPPLAEFLLSHGIEEPDTTYKDPIIDSRGGKVSSGIVTLVIPPDAVSTPTIFPPPGFKKFDVTTFCDEDGQEITRGMVVYLYPHGLKYHKPVMIMLNDETIQPGKQAVVFASDTNEEELPSWENISGRAGIQIDDDKQIATFSTDHFSIAAVFYMAAVSGATLVAITRFLETKNLYIALFWRRDGSGGIRLLICSSFDRNDLTTQPSGVTEQYARATNPSDPVPLAYYDSYKYNLDVDGAKPKPLDKNRLNKRLEAPSQKTVRLLSCSTKVDVRLECSSQHGQVLLEVLLEGQGPQDFAQQPVETHAEASLDPTASIVSADQPAARLTGMTSVWCDRVLHQEFLQLVENMNPDDVVDHLIQEGVFTSRSEEYQVIRAKRTDFEKNRSIITCVMSKGDPAFHTLVRVLREVNPSLGERLSDEYEKLSSGHPL